MSVQTLYSAATGMAAMQTKLDVIANNLANVETTGFKRGRINFEDLFYRHEQMPGEQDASGQYTPIGVSIGLGSRVSGTQTELRQGAFQETGGPLDLAIEGPGFFRVVDPASGDFLYTRAGKFSTNAEGQLVLASAGTGRLLEPPVEIPQDALEIAVSDQGIVSVRQPGQTQLSQAGTIELATFVNPEGLLKLGENLYAETDASGTATTGTPGQEGRGVVKQGFLEASNVEPVRELVDLITTQRAFELNSQAVQVGDEIMRLVANLKRL